METTTQTDYSKPKAELNAANIAKPLTIEPPQPHIARQSCDDCVTKPVCAAGVLKRNMPASYHSRLFRTQRFAKGKHLFYAGDSLSTLYIIKSGSFKTYFCTEEGDEQVMGFALPGDILGADALADQRHNLSYMALETSTLCVAPVNTLKTLANRFAPNWLLQQVHGEVLRERQLMLMTARKYSADTRVAYFLLELSARHRARGLSEVEFKLTMPQRDIAHYLDMALETVSRVFTRLQEHSILIIKRPYVRINKVAELKAMVDESLLP